MGSPCGPRSTRNWSGVAALIGVFSHWLCQLRTQAEAKETLGALDHASNTAPIAINNVCMIVPAAFLPF